MPKDDEEFSNRRFTHESPKAGGESAPKGAKRVQTQKRTATAPSAQKEDTSSTQHRAK